MKHLLFIVTSAVIMASCKQKINPVDDTKVLGVTSEEYADFQAYKEWKAKEAEEKKTSAPVYIVKEKAVATPAVVRSTANTPATTTTTKKKGWSKAAKGTAIGAGVGAAAGAVINKRNRAVGAVIGGVVGGGVGYGIGRSMDKKDGR